jgi:Ring finger domain
MSHSVKCGAFLKGSTHLCCAKGKTDCGGIWYCGRHIKSVVNEKQKEMDKLKEIHDDNQIPIATDECPVCMDAISSQQEQKTLPCGHKFHVQCILGWHIEQGKTACPMCRAPFHLLDKVNKTDIECYLEKCIRQYIRISQDKETHPIIQEWARANVEALRMMDSKTVEEVRDYIISTIQTLRTSNVLRT